MIKYEQAADYIAKLKEIRQDKEYCQSIINDIISLVDTYYFKDIAKEPPIPDGFPKDYFNKVDIIEELKAIPTEDTNMYDLYPNIKKVVMKLKDYHSRLYQYQFSEDVIQIKANLNFYPYNN